MIGPPLARRLRTAGLTWDPARGDAFVIDAADLDDQVFYLSDLTVEVHDSLTGPFLGFNGTTEWALDSVAQEQALWLPREDQLRDRLAGAFVSLTRDGGGYRVLLTDGRTAKGDTAVDAYADALLLTLPRAPADRIGR